MPKTRKSIPRWKRIKRGKAIESLAKQETQAPRVTSTALVRSLQQVWPDIFKVKLRNQFSIVWAGTTGAVNGYLQIANALHNPNGSSVISGANPLTVGAAASVYGLPNLLNIYANYRIICTIVRATTQNTSANLTDASVLYIVPLSPTQLTNLGNVNSLTSNTIDEFPYCIKRYLAGQTMNRGIFSSSCMSTAKMFGLRSPSLISANEYTGITGTNPTNLWYFAFLWFPQTAGTTSGVTLVELEYEVEFFQRNQLSVGQA